jgi:DNA helicase-2/ATP-dependent DNA helicase PcrA
MMDFTDLLTKFVEEGRATEAKVAFIDEAQDLSQAQWKVLQKCFASVDKVIVAGDDDQSIFKWSGADLNTFLNLEGEKRILNRSHRLPRAIYTKAKHVIDQVKDRYSKPFEPTDTEGSVDYVSTLEQANVTQNESTMVLVRNVYLLSPVYEHFKKLGFAYNGRNGFTSIGEGHVGAIRAWEHMRKGNSIPLADARLIYEHLRVGTVLARGGKVALDKHEDTEEGITWETLRDHFGLLSKPLWHEALMGIPLEKREYYISLLRNNVKITAEPNVFINTIHGVKGGEADHVIIVSDMSKRTFMEMQKDPESEHRVSYVALTRAKKRITIVMPNSRYAYTY